MTTPPAVSDEGYDADEAESSVIIGQEPNSGERQDIESERSDRARGYYGEGGTERLADVLQWLVMGRMADMDARLGVQDDVIRALKGELAAVKEETTALKHEAAALNGTIVALRERDRLWAAVMSRPMEVSQHFTCLQARITLTDVLQLWCGSCGTHSIGARWNGEGLEYSTPQFFNVQH